MANTNSPFGFRAYRGTGSSPTYEQTTALIAYDYTTPIYSGDAVIPVSTGYIQQATASTVVIAGIFVGCKYLSTSQKRTVWSPYWPGNDVASTAPDIEAYLISDPNAQFVVQAGGTNIGKANLNEYIQLNVGTGNAATGQSGMYVESPNTTVTLPFIVRGLVDSPPGGPGTLTTGAYNWVIVGFNNAITRTNGAGPTGIA